MLYGAHLIVSCRILSNYTHHWEACLNFDSVFFCPFIFWYGLFSASVEIVVLIKSTRLSETTIIDLSNPFLHAISKEMKKTILPLFHTFGMVVLFQFLFRHLRMSRCQEFSLTSTIQTHNGLEFLKQANFMQCTCFLHHNRWNLTPLLLC